ncbi:MAG TPA: FtsX-like permease family protein [Gemmatimonadaceae bacterium]|nr:FtsX-like permease family protein [Gemmatimonadaceae bacterium]
MRLALAVATLVRHRARTLLALAGVAVAAAMLLDMVMLSTGMRSSLRDLLLVRGFQLRLAPKGTLPFDTEATIAGARGIVDTLRAHPDVVAASPVLGATVHVDRGGRVVTAIALGVEPAVQGDYELVAGRDPAAPDEIVAGEDFLRLTGAAVGDTLALAAGYDPQLRRFAGTRRLAVVGRARFLYMPAGQAAVAIPLGTLQAMAGAERRDRVSVVMVRTRDGADIEAVRAWSERALPRVSAISIATALRQVDERLSYFRQLAFILGAVSLIVGVLLVTTLVTVSVNERLGEIAVMRAIGVSRAHVVHQILLESAALMGAGAMLGLALGLVTARYLNGILADFPGLPAAIDFFLFEPAAAGRALGLLALGGLAAGVYPAWRGASLPIAGTLREEAVG